MSVTRKLHASLKDLVSHQKRNESVQNISLTKTKVRYDPRKALEKSVSKPKRNDWAELISLKTVKRRQGSRIAQI